MHTNQVLKEIPVYLRPYVAKQDPSLYTAIDHASWRFILKMSKSFFANHAHGKYLAGLEQTGISAERIPLISEMDEKLRAFKWRAVAVTGFIPPAVFMEFLSLGILPIACDMRQLGHLAYTPAPDIVHEAAGHAPIIADPEYASYLKSYGEISQKAIFSYQDMDVYQAVRNLSDTKEDPAATVGQIEAAQRKLDEAVKAQTDVSEATYLARMGWWTFEYGLLGDLKNPKIYGAGLLSSMGESYHCFDPEVKKIPFSVDCVETSYDITRPQPQLFVSPDFQTLKDALQELANRMAFRRGGMEGLSKAISARTVTTTQFETGVQISGILVDVISEKDKPVYLKFQGPTQLSYKDRELEGQGAGYHSQGFGTPVEQVTDQDLRSAGLAPGKSGKLELRSGIRISGKLTQALHQDGNLILLTFENCTVSRGSEILFRPEWGNYDMVCGARVISVFGGAADREKYLAATGGFHQDPGKQKTNLTSENRHLNELYAQVRKIRESGVRDHETSTTVYKIMDRLDSEFPEDWLLRYEILEMKKELSFSVERENALQNQLKEIARSSSEKRELIERGLALL